MGSAGWLKIAGWSLLSLGCSGPSLDLPERAGAAAQWSLEVEPAVRLATLPLAFRARIRGAPASGAPWLFRGTLTDYYRRALERGEPPATLRDRATPLRFWREGDATWFQPTHWLDANESYTLAYSGLGVLQVALASAATPRSERVFPAPGRPQYNVSVVCGLGDVSSPASLEPGGAELWVEPGVLGTPRAGCATLRSAAQSLTGLVAPPALGGALLDPAPWLPAPQPLPDSGPNCGEEEAKWEACVDVEDDRISVTPRGDDLLFVLTQPEPRVVVASVGHRTLLLAGLDPGGIVTLQGSVLSSAGQLQSVDEQLTTPAARRHVVLNEVLANPLGPEPDAEWIELLNDSAEAASLAGLWLEDTGGHVELPDVTLEPGELALLVVAGARSSNVDVPLPDAARRIELPSLGAHGLSNEGEALLLVGAEGVVSRFPRLASSHAGHSVARRSPQAADDDAANFAEHGAPGASPGAPNTFDD